MQRISGLAWPNEERYLTVDGQHKVAAWDVKGTYPRLAFGFIRNDDDSRIDNRGSLRPALTQQGDGLTEFTYCVFFPDDIVGVIFDAAGPKLNRVAEYVVSKCSDLYEAIEFSRLVRKDFLTELDRLGAITNFEIAIHPSQVGLFDDIDDTISAALGQLKSVSEGETIRIMIGAGRGKEKSLSSKFRHALKRFLNKPLDRSTVTRLKVTGRDNITGLITPPMDLLVKQFVYGVDVERPASDSDLATDCFRAIESSFIRHAKELRRGSSIESDD